MKYRKEHPQSEKIQHLCQMNRCDYLFAGTGLAALLTAATLADAHKLAGKKVVFIEAESHKGNDRTWCFWDTQPTFPELVVKKWDFAQVNDADTLRRFSMAPLHYFLMRSGSFYDSLRYKLAALPGVQFITAPIQTVNDTGTEVEVQTADGLWVANKVFSSLYTPPEPSSQQQFPLIHQHFVGWFIETDKAAFDPNTVGFMDFSVPQQGNTRFMYVLPFTDKKALVEYTLFSQELLPKAAYETAIKDYLQQKGIVNYRIEETEQGNIPMTCYPFHKRNTQNILYIGTAGGWTKASTGFTFKNSVRKAQALAHNWTDQGPRNLKTSWSRFVFYDRLLLEVLAHENHRGADLFTSLFIKGNPQLVFRFLDEETTLLEEIQLILRCPKMPFLRALWRVLF
jgi:lycopene beta-cyclase